MTTTAPASSAASLSASRSGSSYGPASSGSSSGSSRSAPLTCDACLGSGRHSHFPARACSYCGGTGTQDSDR